jgi:hypothetical protein
MKKSILAVFAIVLLSVFAVSAQDTNIKKNPVGKWKFEAPAAPEGFTTGLIVVGFAENKYSSAISFTGSEYTIPGEKVIVKNDTVNFSVFIEGGDVIIKLKMDSSTKMTGTATTPDGNILLTLTREVLSN